MPTETKHILLVEGIGDQKFFNHLLSILDLQPEIYPKTPRDIDARIYRNGLHPLKAQLKVQLTRLIRGDIEKLGVIVDADHTEQTSNGFSERRAQIIEILEENGFSITEQPTQAGEGELFSHPSNAEVGLWIMPDHFSDGMIEDLFISAIEESGHELLQHTKTTINNLGDLKLFGEHHNNKAKLATWLAWQKEPGISASYAHHKRLFNQQHPGFIALQNWLKRVFATNDNH